MKAWVLKQTYDLNKADKPLFYTELPDPIPQNGELLIKVNACGVCHTEIDEIEGRTPPQYYPVIPGHQVIGTIISKPLKRKDIMTGDRIGVAWIFNTCGKCEFCLSGKENLCNDFIATGRDANGGYAEYMVVPEDFVYKIPEIFTNSEAAPLLCAGAIGFRSLALCNPKNRQNLGLTGFGASGHLVLKLIRHLYPDSEIFVFARNIKEQKFALELGATWAGNTTETPPVLLDSIIDTTPVWLPIIKALEYLKPGGRLVINAIRKELSDIHLLSKLDYSQHLWMEKEIKSVANVTRYDVKEFIRLAAEIPFKPIVEEYPFEKANEALLDIKHKNIKGAKVLIINP